MSKPGSHAVAIDLVGFGRSDKPIRREDYTYQAHVDWRWAALGAIGLNRHDTADPRHDAGSGEGDT